ncbi:hypothetical protein BS17DRAFT_817359 [Gyrodon lividus]|nr:hypothetical protein BS17DRAFT_817359 [Gyrodon lividus]
MPNSTSMHRSLATRSHIGNPTGPKSNALVNLSKPAFAVLGVGVAITELGIRMTFLAPNTFLDQVVSCCVGMTVYDYTDKERLARGM